MAKKNKDELSENQKLLMTVSAAQSTSDWRNNLGNDRLLDSRVLMKKLIRIGHPETLQEIAAYYNVRLEEEPTTND